MRLARRRLGSVIRYGHLALFYLAIFAGISLMGLSLGVCADGRGDMRPACAWLFGRP